MATTHIVVDGSNIATEGRSTPSLAQLNDAIAELQKEFPDASVTAVVDATFSHRIERSELAAFEAAVEAGRFISPPAGAIGRGDAFLLRIAERVDATVLSNDSFQEFHGEHPWLFERGRLIGATPVPGVGWIFVPRTPVRGVKSRTSVRATEREQKKVERAVAAATAEVVEVGPEHAPSNGTPRGARSSSPQAVNDPLTFISFIASHRLGDELIGTVDAFTSHGAVVMVSDVRCYIPLAGLGEPAPKSAREVLRRGEERAFTLIALDPHRRGVELALPGVGIVSGRPRDETVAAEVEMARRGRSDQTRQTARSKAPGRSKKSSEATTASAAAGQGADPTSASTPRSPRRRRSSPAVDAATKVPPPVSDPPAETPVRAPRRVRTLLRRSGPKER